MSARRQTPPSETNTGQRTFRNSFEVSVSIFQGQIYTTELNKDVLNTKILTNIYFWILLRRQFLEAK
jgi:hypothetical protein